MHLTFDPPFPLIHTALLAAICAVAGILLFIHRTGRRLSLTLLRSAALLILAFILVNPVVVTTTDKPRGKQPFLLLVDGSRSMCTEDMEGRTRLDAAKESTVANQPFIAERARKYDLHPFLFAA